MRKKAKALKVHKMLESTAKLCSRYGVDKIFEIAKAADKSRHEKWILYIESNRHKSGYPGIYLERAMALSHRANHAHSVASEIHYMKNDL